MQGMAEMAQDEGIPLKDFLAVVDVIVHGTTVTTNAVLTYGGAKTGLLTTTCVRDALEMRRGIREEQYQQSLHQRCSSCAAIFEIARCGPLGLRS